MYGNDEFALALDGRYAGHESDAELSVVGRVGALQGLRDLHLEFPLKADSLNDVGSISGFELPRNTPVSISVVAANTGEGTGRPRQRAMLGRMGTKTTLIRLAVLGTPIAFLEGIMMYIRRIYAPGGAIYGTKER